MKVVFLEDVPDVAMAGDTKEVASGYARNFLFPKKLAVLATTAELQKVEARHKAEARRQERQEQEAEGVAEELGALTLTLKVRVGKDRIYGSVTSTAIAREIKKLTGREIDKHTIELEKPIRQLGSHQVPIRLAKNVTASVNVIVEGEQVAEQEKEQAAEQEKEQATEQEKEQVAEQEEEQVAEQEEEQAKEEKDEKDQE